MGSARHPRYLGGTQPRPVEERWQRSAEQAAAQHGVVTRTQLRRLGLSDRQITRAIAHARLHPVHRGVFAVGHRRLSVHGRRAAAVLACGAGAALGYRSAAAHWDLRATSSPTTDVVVSRSSRPRHENVIVHQHLRLGGDEVVEHDGILVTTVSRTLLDVAAVLSPAAMRRAVGQADVLQRFDLHALRRLMDRHPRHPGHRVMRELLRTWAEPERTRSALEAQFVVLCDRLGFPCPILNATVLGMEIDAIFPEHRIAVELDGYRSHSGATQWENDHDKRARLVAAGWTVLAYSWRQMRDSDGTFVRETLGPALDRASAATNGVAYR